jgi:uncharacterized protein YifN (PemK superfamily)
LLPDDYPQLLVVPLTRHSRFAQMEALVQRIEPSAENAAPEVSWAVCHHVTSVVRERARSTGSRVSAEEFLGVRMRLLRMLAAERA